MRFERTLRMCWHASARPGVTDLLLQVWSCLAGPLCSVCSLCQHEVLYVRCSVVERV